MSVVLLILCYPTFFSLLFPEQHPTTFCHHTNVPDSHNGWMNLSLICRTGLQTTTKSDNPLKHTTPCLPTCTGLLFQSAEVQVGQGGASRPANVNVHSERVSAAVAAAAAVADHHDQSCTTSKHLL